MSCPPSDAAPPRLALVQPRYRWNVQPRFFVIVGIALALIFGIYSFSQLGGSLSHLAKPAPAPLELPRGGRTIFPTYRLFGYSGYPGAKALGRLGIGNIDDRMKEIETQGAAYVGDRKLLPVMELIAVTVHDKPGADGLYRTRVSDDVIRTWLDAARRHKALLLLNIQPGRAKFIDEVKYFEKWLVEPDVGLALDPEWAVKEGQIPGKVFGSTSGPELDAVSAYVAGLVAAHQLPEKVLLYHQLHVQIVTEEDKLQAREGVALVKSVDGIGSPQLKTASWNKIVERTPKQVHLGFKLFYEEDTRKNGRLMTPQEVMALQPTPEYVLFE